MYKRQETNGEISARADASQRRSLRERTIFGNRLDSRNVIGSVLLATAVLTVANDGARDIALGSLTATAEAIQGIPGSLPASSDCSFTNGQEVTIQPGDTTWGYASEIDGNTGAIAFSIEDHNAIEGSNLTPGTVITLPASCNGNDFPLISR